jgi:hypothetical protein
MRYDCGGSNIGRKAPSINERLRTWSPSILPEALKKTGVHSRISILYTAPWARSEVALTSKSKRLTNVHGNVLTELMGVK